jgi:hypothetical protein
MKSLIALIAGSLLTVQASDAPAANEPKQIASQWYEAFAHHDAGLLEKILAPSWVDIPSPPHAPHGPEAAKAAMAIFPISTSGSRTSSKMETRLATEHVSENR